MLSYAPCGPQGTRERHRTPRTVGAAYRSAAIAWGARPVPFRTRKLSPIAPRVLRGQPVGGQGAADRWTAPGRRMTLRRGRPRGPPFFFALYTRCALGPNSPVCVLTVWLYFESF